MLKQGRQRFLSTSASPSEALEGSHSEGERQSTTMIIKMMRTKELVREAVALKKLNFMKKNHKMLTRPPGRGFVKSFFWSFFSVKKRNIQGFYWILLTQSKASKPLKEIIFKMLSAIASTELCKLVFLLLV